VKYLPEKLGVWGAGFWGGAGRCGRKTKSDEKMHEMAAKRHCFRHFHTKVTILVTIFAKIVHFSVTKAVSKNVSKFALKMETIRHFNPIFPKMFPKTALIWKQSGECLGGTQKETEMAKTVTKIVPKASEGRKR
jgi:hypothetical protein